MSSKHWQSSFLPATMIIGCLQVESQVTSGTTTKYPTPKNIPALQPDDRSESETIPSTIAETSVSDRPKILTGQREVPVQGSFYHDPNASTGFACCASGTHLRGCDGYSWGAHRRGISHHLSRSSIFGPTVYSLSGDS